MTRQEFIDYASKQHSFRLTANQTTADIEKEIARCECINGVIPVETIDFLKWFNNLSLERIETNSGDMLSIQLMSSSVSSFLYWQDKGDIVCYIGYISNCSGIIKKIYMSVELKFYDHNHNLLAEGENSFLRYLATVEFDFHPVIKERVFDALREAGWYENRKIDISDFNNNIMQTGISLSPLQLEFLTEYSGLKFNNDSEFCEFFTIDEIQNKPEFAVSSFNCPSLKIAQTIGSSYYIDANGIIKGMATIPMGRTTMECINHLVKDVFEWLFEPDNPQ